MSDSSQMSKSFLSHNNRDKPAVEVIQGLLERGERPIPCWFDKDDLRSTATWMSQLEDAVATCSAAVVFYGPDGRGPFHKYEIELLLKRAMSEQGRDALRLVLVLLPGAQESAIQGFISLHMWADFRKGLDDTAALQRLRAFILGEAPKSGPGDDSKVPKPEIEPYRGLESFESKHAKYFFGRDNEIKELCGRLQEWPFTAVIGGSGSGKSSIVRAGLQTESAMQQRPALAHTTTITVRPGSNPIRALADQVVASLPDQAATISERLKLVENFDEQFRIGSDKLLNVLRSIYPRDEQQILLVIDQFEELFTHSSDSYEAEQSSSRPPTSDHQPTRFIELLAAVAKSQLDRLRIVITLRADFFDRCLSVPTLKSMIENRTLLLGKLSDDALRTVIEAPAFQVGAYFEKGLVARILKDVENQNGSLPLLQHALKELWEQRRFGFLTDDGYNETGGVEGALKKRANATLQNLNPEQREIAKNIFLRLTTLGEGVSDTRRRVRKNELYPDRTDPRLIDVVLKELSSPANRLIVIGKEKVKDEDTVEVTHEALIQRWDTLKGWLTDNRDDKRLHDRLRDAANEWADPRHERDPSYLWKGGRLDLAEKFDQTHTNMLTVLEREFLGASIVEREHAKSQKEEEEHEKLKQQEALTKAESARARLAEEREAEARVNAAKQRRLTQIGFVIAGFALVAALIAGWQTWRASTARDTAQKKEEEATIAEREATASKQKAQQQQAEANRENANFYWRLAVNARNEKEPDSLKIAHLFLKGAQALDEIPDSLKTTNDRGFLRSNQLAAYATDPRLVRRWFHQSQVAGAQFHADGLRGLTWNDDGTARMWDAATPNPFQPFDHTAPVNGAKFCHNETHVLTWSDDGTACLWQVATGEGARPELIRTFSHGGPVKGARLNPNESRLLTWSNDGVAGTVKLWDVDKPGPIRSFEHGWGVGGADFYHDDTQFVTWESHSFGRQTQPCEVLFWAVDKTNPKMKLPHDEGVNGVQLSSDESQALTQTLHSVQLWDIQALVDGKPKLIQRFPLNGAVWNATFIRSGRQVLIEYLEFGAQVWTIASTDQLDRTPDNPMTSFGGDRMLALSSDQKVALTSNRDGTLRLWDMLSNDESKIVPLKTFQNSAFVKRACFSNDNQRVLTWNDFSAQLWDSTTVDGSAKSPLQNLIHMDNVRGAMFSPDGSKVLIWTIDGTMWLWHVRPLKPIQTSRDGRLLKGKKNDEGALRVQMKMIDTRLHLWDAKENRSIREFPHDRFILGGVLSRDGTHAITWSMDKTAKLWDVSKPKPLQTYVHNGYVTGARFDRDECHILTWSSDKTVRLWDVSKSEAIVTIKHDAGLIDAQFGENERTIVTLAYGLIERIWDIDGVVPPLNSAERLLELKVRSGMMLDDAQNLQTLTFDEWNQEVNSLAYQAIAKKLSNPPWQPGKELKATSDKPADADGRSEPTAECNNATK